MQHDTSQMAWWIQNIIHPERPSTHKVRPSENLLENFRKFFKIFQNISQKFQKIFQKFSKIVHNFSKNGYVVPPPWSSPPATFKITDLGDSNSYLQKEDLKKITLEAIATETPADAA